MITSTKTEDTVDEKILSKLNITPKELYSVDKECNVIQSFKFDFEADEKGDIRIYLESKIKTANGFLGMFSKVIRKYLEDNEQMVLMLKEALFECPRPVDIHNSKTFQNLKEQLLKEEASDLFIVPLENMTLTGLGITIQSDTKEVISFSRTLNSKKLNADSIDLKDNIVFNNSKLDDASNVSYFYDEYFNRIFIVKDRAVLGLLKGEFDYDLKQILDEINPLPPGETRQHLFNEYVNVKTKESKINNIAKSFGDIDLF